MALSDTLTRKFLTCRNSKEVMLFVEQLKAILLMESAEGTVMGRCC